MYKLISAIARVSNSDGKYHEVDIADLPIREIFVKYPKVFAKLSHTIVAGTFILDLNDLEPEVKGYTITLPEWLVINDNNTLPTKDGDVVFEEKYVHFYDGWSSGFVPKAMNRNFHPNTTIPDSLKTDLLLAHPGEIDYAAMVRHCLFTVNGFIHIADTLDEGILVYDGALNAEVAAGRLFGFIDFQHIGPLESIPITESMIYKRHEEQLLKEVVHIKLPKPLQGKVPFLVLGGYLHALDGLYRVVSETVIAFDFYRYSFLRRWYQAKEYLDVSSMPAHQLENGVDSVEMMFSDEFIKAWFTLNQSFIVFLDSTDIYTSTMEVANVNLPGVYSTGEIPKYPLIVADGRIAEYKRNDQRGQWAIRTDGYLEDNILRDNNDYKRWAGVNNARISHRQTLPAKARFLVISKSMEVQLDGSDN